jgi:hypothetical protein
MSHHHDAEWPLNAYCAGRISIDRIKQLYDLNSAVMAAARMPQIVKNFKVEYAADFVN